MENQHKPIELKSGNYYYLFYQNVNTNKVLTLSTETNQIELQQFRANSLHQIWMIEEVQSFQFEIVHAYSTLVLTHVKKNMCLKYGKQASNQLFFLQKSNPKSHPNQFWIKQSKQSSKSCTFQSILPAELKQQQPIDTKFQLCRVSLKNQIYNNCCILEYAYSNLVADVPGASEKEGIPIIQYTINQRFNQRWKVKKFENYFYFINLRSSKYLSIKDGKEKVGAEIVQESLKEGADHQLWKVQREGPRLFIIRSKLNEDLLLGMEGNSMNDEAKLVTTKQHEYAFWRIIGDVQI